jgi:sterol desaturase/sphingolipid hydroxylase (fatty acid hydroxylase superfamily)
MGRNDRALNKENRHMLLYLYAMLAVGILVAGVVMTALTMFYRSPASENRQLRQERTRPSGAADFRRRWALNALVSLGLVGGLTYGLYPYLFAEGSASLTRIAWEGLAILALYDFFYYLVHRYPFHEWKLLRHVHAVHHVVKTPCAADSLYLHPVETSLGLGLLWACAGLVVVVAGPVSIYSFGWAFFVYSTLNVVIHSGLRLPAFPFGPINYLTERHQKHHVGMNAKNYSSVTPTFDLLFGTEVRSS